MAFTVPGRVVAQGLVPSRYSINICWRNGGINFLFRHTFVSWVPIQQDFGLGPIQKCRNLDPLWVPRCTMSDLHVSAHALFLLIYFLELGRSNTNWDIAWFFVCSLHASRTCPCCKSASSMGCDVALVWWVPSAFLPKIREEFTHESPWVCYYQVERNPGWFHGGTAAIWNLVSYMPAFPPSESPHCTVMWDWEYLISLWVSQEFSAFSWCLNDNLFVFFLSLLGNYFCLSGDVKSAAGWTCRNCQKQ